MLRPRLILLSFSLVMALSLSAFAQTPLTLTFDFRNGAEGWQADFSDYPPATNQSGFYELQAGIRSLPPEINASRTGFFFQGNNHSDDLFMFMKRRLGPSEGIVANTRYQITYTLTMASNAQSGCIGAGGSAESVYLKAGASPYEPLPFLASNGMLVMNVDKGNQGVGGPAASVAGNIANGTPCNSGVSPYVTIQRVHQHTTEVAASPAGELWLLVGTDSGYEGRTTYYYQSIKVTLTPMGTAATPPLLLTYPNTTQALALDSVTFMRDPFPPFNARNFSADGRTRVMLFARDLELAPGEDASAVTAEAEDLQHRVYPLAVEYVGKVPDFTWLTQINLKLPDEIYEAGGCWITIRAHGLASNRVLVSLKAPSSSP